jgi:hypothetical protein
MKESKIQKKKKKRHEIKLGSAAILTNQDQLSLF